MLAHLGPRYRKCRKPCGRRGFCEALRRQKTLEVVGRWLQNEEEVKEARGVTHARLPDHGGVQSLILTALDATDRPFCELRHESSSSPESALSRQALSQHSLHPPPRIIR